MYWIMHPAVFAELYSSRIMMAVDNNIKSGRPQSHTAVSVVHPSNIYKCILLMSDLKIIKGKIFNNIH